MMVAILAFLGLALSTSAGTVTTGYNNAIALTGSPAPSTFRAPVVAKDASGNTWLVNVFQAGSESYGSFTVSGTNMTMAIAKQSSSKTFLLAIKFEVTDVLNNLVVSDAKADSLGRLTVLGSVKGTLRINSTLVLTSSSGRYSVFMIQVSSSGVVLATRISTNTAGDAYSTSLTIDAYDNIYGGGGYNGSFSFSGLSLPSSGSYSDGYILNVSSALVGNSYKVLSGSGSHSVSVRSLSYHASSGSIIVGGDFYSNVQIGSNSFSDSNLRNVFTAELSFAGAWLWSIAGAFSVSGTTSNAYLASAVRCGAKIHVGGRFSTTSGTYFNLGSFSMTTLPYDGFVGAIDATTHAFTSANQYFASSDARVMSLQCDPTGVLTWVGGTYGTSANLSGTAVSTANGNTAMVLASLSSTSVFGNVTSPVITGVGASIVEDMIFHDSGLLAITGEQSGSVTYGGKKVTSDNGFLVFYQP